MCANSCGFDKNFHFDGVMFGASDEEVIVTEGECWQYVQQAALFWIERKQADAIPVKRILLRVPG